MTVNINNLTLTTPLPTSAKNPVALEMKGSEAIAKYPSIIKVLDDGSVQLSAPTKGASSKSTRRTRCEWSESTNWTLASATEHLNRQTMRLTKVNSAHKVVVSQMHVRGDDGPPVKVFWNKGSLTLGFRRTYSQATPTNMTVLENVPLGAEFTVTLQATAQGQITVTAKCNGASGSCGPLQFDKTWSSQRFEFHGGVYNQVDQTETTPADDGSICIISTLSLTHR